MATRPDTLETVRLTVELLRRIPRVHKITVSELQQQLRDVGIQRDERTIQRLLKMLSSHFEIERDERSKPYSYRWLEAARPLAVPTLTTQESLLLQLAEEHLSQLLPTRVIKGMEGFFDQARRNLGPTKDARLERQWPGKVRLVATSQPLLPPPIAASVLEEVSEALYTNHWLELDYQNAAAQRSQVKVMPLGLALQGPRLYLVCRYDGYEDERSLALHRIRSAKVSTLGFERPPGFDLQKYDADGRFGFGDGTQVRLSFHIEKDAGFHLTESPLSLDQQVQELPDGWLRVSATVVDSAMLDWWLRGFGDALCNIHKENL